MKYIFLFLLFAGALPILSSVVQSESWSNPHKYYFKAQNEPLKFENLKKPELNQVAEEKYYSLLFEKERIKYEGLFTIKPGPDGKPKFGGAFYKDRETDKLSMLDIEVVENSNYYTLVVKTKNASGLFKSKNAYQKKDDFPANFEIRTHPVNGRPTLILSHKSLTEGTALKFTELKEPFERKVIGKWRGYDSVRGDWNFEINQLNKFQVNGTAKLIVDEVTECFYPIFGFVGPQNNVVILTGESVENADKCSVRGWKAIANQDSGIEMVDLHERNFHSSFQLSANR